MKLLVAPAVVALVIATLFWGGCVSCPQFFMFGQSQQDCCDTEGKCRRAPAKAEPDQECRKMSFGHPEQAVAIVSMPDERSVGPIELSLTIAPLRLADSPEPVEHSPPDLLALNSTLLI